MKKTWSVEVMLVEHKFDESSLDPIDSDVLEEEEIKECQEFSDAKKFYDKMLEVGWELA